MRKLIATLLVIVMMMSLCVPALAATTEPTAPDTSAETLAKFNSDLTIYLIIVAVVTVLAIIFVLIKMKSLKGQN